MFFQHKINKDLTQLIWIDYFRGNSFIEMFKIQIPKLLCTYKTKYYFWQL